MLSYQLKYSLYLIKIIKNLDDVEQHLLVDKNSIHRDKIYSQVFRAQDNKNCFGRHLFS